MTYAGFCFGGNKIVGHGTQTTLFFRFWLRELLFETHPAPLTFPTLLQLTHTTPRRCIRTQESPRDAKVTQAPAGAIDHGQIRAAASGRDCGWRACNARGTARRKDPGRVG